MRALVLVGLWALVACSDRPVVKTPPADTTAVADSEHHNGHDDHEDHGKPKPKHPGHP